MKDHSRFINSDVEAYVLTHNAFFHFREFANSIAKTGISNNGKNKLFNEIDKYIYGDDDKRFYRTLNVGKRLYRARTISQSDLDSCKGINIFEKDEKYTTFGFDEGNSREAPLGCSDAGRNNIKGVSYLYLADKIQTACVEVKPYCGQLISVAEFKCKKDLNIIDFSNNVDFDIEESREDNIALGTFFTIVMSRFFLPVADESEYLATQILTDHIRKSGIDGIAYKSFYDRKGTNFTIFNSSRNSIEFIGSKIVMHKSVSNSFLDFNNGEILKTDSMSNGKYDMRSADDICKRIRNNIDKDV